jgi:thioredoxin 1
MEGINDSEAYKLIETGKPVMVFCHATWCGPCVELEPAIIDLTQEYGNDIDIVSIEVDKNTRLATEQNVRNIPTVLFFNDGSLKTRIIGAHPIHDYKDVLDSLLKIEVKEDDK